MGVGAKGGHRSGGGGNCEIEFHDEFIDVFVQLFIFGIPMKAIIVLWDE
jgi:hypothetical protein